VGVALFTGLDHDLTVGLSAIVMAVLAFASTLVVVAVWPAPREPAVATTATARTPRSVQMR
jgi:hypothetical protein